MSKIALATAVAVMTVAPLATGWAQVPAPARFVPPPGAAAPWAGTTTATATPAAPVPASTPGPATQPPQAVTVDTAPPVPTTAALPPGAMPMQGTTTPISVVSLRAGPNTGAPVIGTLHPGEQLEVLATANHGWTEVRSSTGTGWAYGSYLASGLGVRASRSVVPMPSEDSNEQ